MTKSSQAFRTIREVAEWLDVAAHVLRFWESKFPQIKPVKRAGGRRYYRPSDMELVGGIKVLLHDRGLTIRGVQRLIRDEGLASVMALSPPLGVADISEVEPLAHASDAPVQEGGDAAAQDLPQDAVPTAAVAVPVAPPPVPLAPAPVPAPVPAPAPKPMPQARPPAPEQDAQQPSLALDLPLHPAPIPAAQSRAETAPSPDSQANLARLAARVADRSGLSPAMRASVRPALMALRDKMRADPPV